MDWVKITDGLPDYDVAVFVWENRSRTWFLTGRRRMDTFEYIGDGWILPGCSRPVSFPDVKKGRLDITHWFYLSPPKETLI